MPFATLLALAIATVWLTFVSIKLGAGERAAFALSGWRFFMAAVPLVLFVGRPQVPWCWLVLYALFIAVGQFAVMFISLNMVMPAGLMSLVVQTQVFSPLASQWRSHGETIHRAQLVGALIAAIGLVIIGVTKLQRRCRAAFLLVLLAAFFWGAGNTVAKHVARIAHTWSSQRDELCGWTSLAPCRRWW